MESENIRAIAAGLPLFHISFVALLFQTLSLGLPSAGRFDS